MDAATPFRRSLGLFVLAALGCQSAGVDCPVGRAQSPSDPVPGRPVAATPASYTPTAAAAAALAGDPRIKVVAVVGLRNTVTDQEVWEAARQRVGEYINVVDGPKGQTVVRDDAKAKEVYADELKRIVERELVLDEMEAKLKKSGKAHVMEQIREYAGQMADRRVAAFKAKTKAKSDDDFRAVLAVQGLTPAVVRRQMERQIMADEYVRNSLKERGRTVGVGDVRRYYDEHPAEFTRPDRAKWQHIFVSAGKFPTREAARTHAEQVRAAAAGGADFVALCKEHDHGTAAMAKAEGTGQKKGEIQPAELEATVFATPAGGVGPLVETPTGFHLVKVVERDAAGVAPFTKEVQDDIREKLMRRLQEAEYHRIVGELWQRGVVRFNPAT